MPKTLKPTSPESIAVLLAIVFCAVVIIAAAALGGSYLIAFDAAHQATHAVNAAEAAQHALQVREQTSQLRSAIPTCKALHAIAQDSTALLKSASGKAAAKVPNNPIVDFFAQFPKIYNSFGCSKVFAFAKSGK